MLILPTEITKHVFGKIRDSVMMCDYELIKNKHFRICIFKYECFFALRYYMLTIVKTHCYSDKENIFKHLMLQLCSKHFK